MVLTEGKPATAQRWADDLERFRAALGRMVPVDQARLTPVAVVIFPNDKAFRPYKMLQNGKPAEVGGFFSNANGVRAIGLAVDYDSDQTRRVIFHEATHWFYSARAERLPPWLEEGIAEVFSTFHADGSHFTVGDAIANHVDFLRNNDLEPLAKLFGTAQADIDYHERDRAGLFYAESWLVVHWAMFGEGSPGADSLSRYVTALKTARSSEAAFAAAFGGDYRTIDHRLAVYLRSGEYIRRSYVLRAADLVASEPPRPATEGEVEYALGALQLGGRGAPEALPHLERAVALEPANVAAWEALGFARLAQDEKDAALAAFDHATRLGSHNALVWHNHAVLRQEAELPAGEFVVTTNWEMFNESARDYRQAIALDPRCQPAYEGLAGVVYGAQPADAADLARLEQGRRFFPGDRMITTGVAAAQLRVGDRAAATKDLRAIFDAADAAPAVRQLARSALEGEVLAKVKAQFESTQRDRRYADLIAGIDEALKEDVLAPENRRALVAQRHEVDQWRRLDAAVNLVNSGRRAEAAVAVRMILDEPPANGIMRQEAERVLKACGP
ncbi:MAG TPA: hypothetical protein VG710_00435 [Opitutus sp.]|nr:hypothetical protein [Opitutus sp.]